MKKAALIFTAIFAGAATLMLAFLFYYLGVTAGVKLDREKLVLDSSCVRIFDDAGEELPAAISRGTADFSELPEYLPKAFVAVEDKRFFTHHGFDYKRIGKAILKNLSSLSFREGASTISQQLIKNTHLSGEKTVKRKLKEYKLTRTLEKNYTKEEILSLYLNSIYFGHNAFGIERAAKFYFGKEPSLLTPAESAMLAALVKSPNRYSPFRDAEKCLKRRNFVLSLMKEQGYLSQAQYSEAIGEPLPETPAEEDREGSSYLSLVYAELGELFPDAKSGELASLNVYTALDKSLQQELETTRSDSDVSVLVRDNDGSTLKAFYSTAGTPKRLPASVIKPLLVYAPALEENYITPATPVLDEKTNFSGYCPSDYGGKYGGYMSVRYALSHSVNVPTVKILNEIGVERACSYLRRTGLDVPEEDYSLALALGGMKEGFTLPALADAYSVFARGGYFTPARTILRIESGEGKLLYEYKPRSNPAFSEDVCFLINDMLRTAAQEGTAKTLRSLPFPVCAKTGTGAGAEGNTDAYTVAYTKQHTVAVWMGNRDNSPVTTTGGGLPANVALRVFKALYRGSAPEPFPPCDKVEKLAFDREEYEKNHMILLADPAAPPVTTLCDYFRKCAPPTAFSSRFSDPTIQKPGISIKNGAVCIELCQTEYYDYVIKRKNNGEELTVYSGKYRSEIFDNSVQSGKTYEYSVTPYYKGKAGKTVSLPAVKIPQSASLPEEWWMD
ncbi:MAG: transglycosylase domain-containing protein [Candidatus Gallimonas sp.]